MALSFPIRGPSVQRMVKELGIPLGSAQLIKQAMEHGRAKTALTLANDAMNGYGVESLWPEYPNLSYVNMGDTYERTLLYTGKSFQIGSWGDHVEGHRGVAHDGSNPRDSKYWKADPRWAKRGPVKHPFQNDLGRQHIVRTCKNCVFNGKECDGSIYPECRSYAAPADIKRLVARAKQERKGKTRAKVRTPIHTSNGLHREVGGGEPKIIDGKKYTFETLFDTQKEAVDFANALRPQGYQARIIRWEVPEEVTRRYPKACPEYGSKNEVRWCVYIRRNASAKKGGKCQEWSGVSYAPHAKGVRCSRCGHHVHKEGDAYYCPACDDYVNITQAKTSRKPREKAKKPDVSFGGIPIRRVW